MTDSSKNYNTVYGSVNKKKLNELQQNFDTTQILTAIDIIDEIRYRICEPEHMRDELLNLHSMAHTIINGDWTMNAPKGLSIWETAQDLEMEISEFATKLDKITDMLRQLGELVPNEEYDEDDDEDLDGL
jgi:AraC-like DNA-binding protein